MVNGARALVVVGAAVMCGSSYFRNWQNERQPMQAVERCEAEEVVERKQTDLHLRLFCNVFEIDELKGRGTQLIGTQKEIADLLDESRQRAPDLWFGSGLLFFVVFAVPYPWYFLLRRLREMLDALTGKGA